MKTAKKLGAILLALVMCLSLCSVAFAASSDDAGKGSITITGAVSGQEYSIYKIFDVTYDTVGTGEDSSTTYSYQATSGWSSWLSNYTYSYVNDEEQTITGKLFVLDNNGYLDPASYIFSASDDVVAQFARDALAYATGEGNITATKTDTATSTTVEFNNLDLGWYLVSSSLGSLCMLDTTDPDATIEEKNGTPTPTKFVDNVSDEDVENNSIHEYEIYIDNIQGVVHLSLEDIMDPELQLVEDTENKANTFTITIIDANGNTLATLEYGKDFTYSETTTTAAKEVGNHTYAAGSTDIIIYFYDGNVTDGVPDENYTEYDFSSFSSTDQIKITYKCTVDTEGDAYANDYDDLLNDIQLTYAYIPATSTWVQAEVELFGFEVKKTDGTDPLANATFELINSQNQVAYFIYEEATDDVDHAIYLLEGWGTAPTDDGNSYTSDLVSGEDGMIYIEGLTDGTYTLKETAAPDGYNMLDYDITITIADGTVEGVNKGTVTYSYTVNGTTTSGTAEGKLITVVNNTGTELPGTGGIGTTIFYVLGGIIVVGAVVVLVTRKRMGAAD